MTYGGSTTGAAHQTARGFDHACADLALSLQRMATLSAEIAKGFRSLAEHAKTV